MAHDLVTELLQYSSLACFMPIWQLCANLLIPNCLRSNLSYSPLAALELYVNKANSEYLLKGFRHNVAYGETDDRFFFSVLADECCSFRMRVRAKSQLGDYLYSNYIYVKYIR